MGYAEFGGTGSVKWRVVHGDKTQKAKDKDPKPETLSGNFVVCFNGKEVYRGELKNNTVTVIWPPDSDSLDACTAVAVDAEARAKKDKEDEVRRATPGTA